MFIATILRPKPITIFTDTQFSTYNLLNLKTWNTASHTCFQPQNKAFKHPRINEVELNQCEICQAN